MAERPYYRCYEDRYRRVYAQGVEYWTANPAEIAESTALLDEFLDAVLAVPGRDRFIECGCGEGHLACHLLRKGYDYLGVDVAPSAIAKAEQRVRREAGADPAGRFVLLDITKMDALADGSFDISVDDFCLHMLVTDPDRARYLSELRRLLREGGRAYFRENLRQQGPRGPIASFAESVERFAPDLTALAERDAYSDGKRCTIMLPQVPACADNEEGYRRALTEVGFRVTQFRALDSTCIFYATV